MKRRTIAAIGCIALLVLAAGLAGCDTRDFNNARKERTIEAYQEYLRNHPRGKHAAAAWSQIENLSYNRAVRENTVSAYREFLDEFPNSGHKAKADKEIKLLCRRWADRLSLEDLEKIRIKVETSMGGFSFRLLPGDAPIHSRNMAYLAVVGFYPGQVITTVEKGVLAHMGDPAGTGLGGPGYTIPFEVNSLRHTRGAVSMFHLPMDRDSAGSQFFICLSDVPRFDGQYSVFGEVVDGLETLDRISEVKVKSDSGRGAVTPEAPIDIERFEVEGVKLPD